MRPVLIILLVVLVSAIEQWLGYWLRWWGIPIPIAAVSLLMGCLWLESRWWPWLGLAIGLTQDIFGVGYVGQSSVWWWLWMSGAWWLESRLPRDSGWRWLILVGWVALAVLLQPWYETLLAGPGAWAGWWPGLVWLSLGSTMLFLVVGWPLSWLLKQRHTDVGQI